MAGYFTMSDDGGNTWSDPEKFTPEFPLLDWRYPSIAEVSPVGFSTVHIVMQGDSLPGSTVNTAGMPVGVTAQYYHFSTEILLPSVDGRDAVVDKFNLDQNYPNPFNPSTVIQYSIPTSSFTQLSVFDVLGNEVAKLVNEEKPEGKYEVEFNAEGLTSGVYFYKLNAGSFVSTKKMLLLK
ncbi:MAG: T9SS type A sorting domain-containing protein [Ignavibacteriaceae bacterium]|nr:T9SS type A sorting domain-containing protein [Ignavibacteriaceae bacterium]